MAQMIVELQYGTRLLRPTLRDAPVGEVVIEQLDATEDISLRTVCWLEENRPEKFEQALTDDRTVEEATRVVTTDHGYQYQVTHSRKCPGTEVYCEAIKKDGIFVSGAADVNQWELRMRFPDREAFSSFRDACEQSELDLSVQAVHEEEELATPGAQRHGLSDPQQEILLLAAKRGYFEVPRQASLADLAEELDISSQAASERLRRGLDSVVENALLTPE